MHRLHVIKQRAEKFVLREAKTKKLSLRPAKQMRPSLGEHSV